MKAALALALFGAFSIWVSGGWRGFVRRNPADPLSPLQIFGAVTLAAMLVLVSGCASAPPPQVVIVPRPVYVYVPEKSGPPVPPGEGIAPSPLLVEAEQRRAEHLAEVAASEPPRPVVYESAPYYVWRDPYPVSSVIVVDDFHGHHGHHHHGSNGHHDHADHGGHHVDHHQAHGPRQSERSRERAAARCGGRATEWARERCLRGVAQR